jgi:hypothetical protein
MAEGEPFTLIDRLKADGNLTARTKSSRLTASA